jgi:hypothetical protein
LRLASLNRERKKIQTTRIVPATDSKTSQSLVYVNCVKAMTDHVKPIFLPAGVADPDGTVGYVAGTASGIDAIELLNGKVIWRTELIARPVFVFENLLVTLRTIEDRTNSLRLICLDRIKNADPVLESDAIEFPEWVTVNTLPDQSFSYDISADQNELILEWEAHARYRGGASPSAHILAQSTQDAAGVVRFNLRSGKVSKSDREEKKIELPDDLEGAILFSYQQGASSVWHSEPWTFDGNFGVIIGEVSGDQQTLKLQTWDGASAKVDEAVLLLTGEALVSYVTPDGLCVLIHSEAQHQEHDWWLFSVKTGKRLAVLNYEEGAKEACVLNSRVFYLVEDPPPAQRRDAGILRSTIKAVEISSGKVVWERLLSEQPPRRQPALRQ